MRVSKWTVLLVALVFVAVAGLATAEEFKLNIGGTTYTKWLWGNMRDSGSMYNFTTVPGEGYGDNGQGSEVELLLDAKVSRAVSVKARLHSRFSQNEWTNFGGFGGTNPPKDCTGGDCGEYDPRSNQYVKLRGVAVTFTPGYKWIDSATIGANDFGMFDPFVLGRIRYIDRDNGAGLLFQGSVNRRAFTWDVVRVSLPRLWAGPAYNTGKFASSDAAYAAQFKYTASPVVDFGGIFQYVNDIEVNNEDNSNWDNGRDYRTRFRNNVWGAKLGIHPSSVVDIRGAYYFSSVDSVQTGLTGSCGGNPCEPPASFGTLFGYSPVIAGKHRDASWKANFDFNDPFSNGLSFNFEVFSIGAKYASMMAARRESDVLLTEGHDSTWAFPGPANASFGVWGGNATRIGYGGWDGNAQQVATINVDNEFTDFDEPMAETVIGWKGVTFTPTYAGGALELAGEYTYLDYNTNWQAYGYPDRSIDNTFFPGAEMDNGVGHNFRSAYVPFQDKTTQIALIKGKYVLDVGKGVDLFFKVKTIQEKDYRMNDARYLPYLAADCPGGGVACTNNKRYYSGSNSTAGLYDNPSVITVNGVTGYQFKPFDSLSDDDRDLDYNMLQLGAGYQLSSDFYGSVAWEYYKVNLQDGNTAFQAYKVNEMASGKHEKNKVILKGRYVIGGAEVGLEYQWNFGTFEPDFGDGFVVQYASADTAKNVHVKVGSRGFSGRWGGWNSLERRSFNQQRLKAFMKVQF